MKGRFFEFTSYDGHTVVAVQASDLIAAIDPAADRTEGKEMPEIGKTVPSGYCRLMLRHHPDITVKTYVSDVARILEEE